MQREGCRLIAYRDSTGVLTTCTGHTGCASPPAVTAGMAITQAQTDAVLEADLAPFEAAVNKALTRMPTQN
jgi:lysozyme